MLSVSARKSRRLLMAPAAFVVLALVCVLALPAVASAAWPAGAELVSGSITGGLQGSQASSAVSVSSDGNFAVFATSSPEIAPAGAPQGGIFRKDLTDDSAPIEIVAKYPAATPVCKPINPSISGNGRYVAFTAGIDGIVPGDTNGRADVFVRDMNDAIDAVGAIELVSAIDGSATGAQYTIPVEDGASPPAGQECTFGAKLPQNSGDAISDDGRKVVFTNNAYTNMFSPTAGNGTAPGQLFVRDLDAQTTTLVTKIAYDLVSPEPSLPVGEIGEPLTDVAPFVAGQTKPDVYSAFEPQAAISGDGTTVTWVGVWARMQTEYQASEEWGFDGGSSGPEARFYLWKRIADGAAAKTRRVTGWVDLDDPGCNKTTQGYDFSLNDAGVSAGEAACRGPFLTTESAGTCPDLLAPSISRDGYTVMFGSCEELRENAISAGTSVDVFLSDMSPGVTRKQGVDELTREVNLVDPTRILNFAISGDGRRAAIATNRSDFGGVSSLNASGTFPPIGLPRTRMFVIDGGCGSAPLSSGTIQWAGRPPSGDLTRAGSPASISPALALDDDGATVVFGSVADNLFTGHNGVAQSMAVKDPAGGCVDPPVVEISAPAESSTATTATPSLMFTVDGASGQSAQCALDGGAEFACTSGASLPTLANGAHTLVVAKSNSGGTGSDSVNFTVDVPLPPAPTVIISAPAEGSTATTATPSLMFTVDGASGQSAQCALDGGAEFACTSGTSLPALAEGAHALTVAKSNAGGTGTDVVNFTVDLPEPPVIQPPPGGGGGGGGSVVAELSLDKAAVKGTVATLPVTVNAAGSISATASAKLPKGKKLKSTVVAKANGAASGAGTTTLKLSLNSAAKKQLNKKRSLSVAVKVVFTAADGSVVERSVTLKFKSAKKKKKKK